MMHKYNVKDKLTSAFAYGDNHYSVIDGVVELPDALAIDLLAAGLITPVTVEVPAEVVVVQPVQEPPAPVKQRKAKK
jgi:hypothetical protein